MLASDEDKFSRVSASQAVFLRVYRAVRDSAFFVVCSLSSKSKYRFRLAGLRIMLTVEYKWNLKNIQSWCRKIDVTLAITSRTNELGCMPFQCHAGIHTCSAVPVCH